MQLLELAGRVEAATGPDRGLDALIKEAFGHSWDYSADWRGWNNEKNIREDKPVAFPYTASLDAAVSLVPEGLSFEVRSSGIGDKGQATVWDPMTQPGLPSFRSWRVTGCSSPALALVAAALRARAGGQA